MANTSAPLSEVAIANMGGGMLEERAMESLDDTSSYAKFCAREFGYVRDELLRSFPWPFAKAFATPALLETAPAFSWDYAYQLPTDFLRVVYIRKNGKLNGKRVPFERVGQEIYTNEGPVLHLVYVKRVTNAALFDPLFARLLGTRLALLAAQRITGKSTYLDKVAALYNEAKKDAHFHNSVDALDTEYVDSPFLNADTVRGVDIDTEYSWG